MFLFCVLLTCLSSNLGAQQTLPTIPHPQSLALVKAPSSQELAEDNILSRFLEFFAARARRSSWTLKLPQLKNNPDAHALRSSLRAVSLAYLAHVTQDRAVQVESLRHYGQSLARQRSALTRLPSFFHHLPSSVETVSIDVDATTNALLATVILSYFELICPSGFVQHMPSSTAWINHTLASERLIAMLGPQAVSNDIIGQLFFSIRSHAVYRAAVLGHYTVFGEREWLDAAARQVPRQSYARTAYDRVTEWILRLCSLRLTRSKVHDIEIRHLTAEEARTEEQDTAGFLLEELKRRYHAFLRCCRQVALEEVPLFMSISTTPMRSQPATSSPPAEQTSANTETPTQSPRIQEDVLLQRNPARVYCLTTGVLAEGPADLSDLHPRLQKLFAAMTTAYFHAAAILLHTYFPEVAQRSSADVGKFDTAQLVNDDSQREAEWDVLYNARVILAAGKYLSGEGRSNGTAVLRMMLPFSIVWHFCRGANGMTAGQPALPEGQRRDAGLEAQLVRLEARKLFSDWCTREGMSGLVSVGFRDLS